MFATIGKIISFFDGKKTMLASLGTALVGTGTIAANAADKGIGYLLHVAGTPEFAAASIGWIGFFSALKGEKIRAEIADVKADTTATATATDASVQPPVDPAKGGTK